MKHLVQMREKHGKDGFVVLTVCIKLQEDDSWDKTKKDALKALRDNNITAPNFLLTGLQGDKAAARFHHVDGGYPCVFVFNRQGMWKKLTGSEKEVDAVILQFLKEK